MQKHPKTCQNAGSAQLQPMHATRKCFRTLSDCRMLCECLRMLSTTLELRTQHARFRANSWTPGTSDPKTGTPAIPGKPRPRCAYNKPKRRGMTTNAIWARLTCKPPRLCSSGRSMQAGIVLRAKTEPSGRTQHAKGHHGNKTTTGTETKHGQQHRNH